MKVLVINAGSGSQKAALFVLPDGEELPEVTEPVWRASLSQTDPGQPKDRLSVRVSWENGESEVVDSLPRDAEVEEKTRRLLKPLWTGKRAPLGSAAEVDLVGHRVVHGGRHFGSATEISDAVEKVIADMGELAPLHNPNSLRGLRVSRELISGAPHYAVFDTAFHQTLPARAFTYAVPRAWTEAGLRRFGFHGISYRWASERIARLIGPQKEELRLILCHLGGGCSLCATVDGRSVDTTMGLTPLDGIAMSTRSGAVDPGLLMHLLRRGWSLEELEETLNHRSGLAGMAEAPGDTRVIRSRADEGDAKAREALEVFTYRLRSGIGQMYAALGAAPHAIGFTDVIGESEPGIRAEACEVLAPLGLRLDAAANETASGDTEISCGDSIVKAYVIQGREEWQMTREILAARG